MNILFLIGNGFDLNLGLNTSYTYFYQYYSSIESENSLIDKLKDNISRDIDTWADLEIALGLYTANLETREEFDTIFHDIEDKLSDYLQDQEDKFKFNNKKIDRFYEFLGFPEKLLPKADENMINEYKNTWSNNPWNIDIITFNYTRIIEKILDDPQQNIDIGKHHNGKDINLRPIQHIHGYLNNRMVMGVNDISQIKNTSFHKNNDIIESLIKEKCNKAHRHTIDDLCVNKVNRAHLICIFGSSLNITDKIWWEKIGNRLKRNCVLIIFAVGEKVDQKRKHLEARFERKIKNDFLEQTSLNKDEINSVKDRIYVSYNSKMFKDIC